MLYIVFSDVRLPCIFSTARNNVFLFRRDLWTGVYIYLPCSTILPSSKTRMRSALITVDSRWATIMVVLFSHILARLA